jgi:putative heme-binding domain-containing protein
MRRCVACASFVLLVSVFLVRPHFAQQPAASQPSAADPDLFARDNLVAWCIVPFDDRKRTPDERAAMMHQLGITKYAYDYRAEHIPEFDAEMEAIGRRQIQLVSWWFPTVLTDEARLILDVLKRHQIRTQLWVTGGGGPTASPEEQRQRVVAEAARLRPILEAAAEIGCTVGLYNHGGWFGEPANQIEIIQELKTQNLTNVGIVYNQHHGHEHLDSFAQLLERMQPYLVCLNLNGMVTDGERRGHKIVPLGQGDRDLELLRIIRASDYRGPIGILNHTQENAELRLQDNLDGLEWLVAQLDGKPAGQRPVPRTWQRPADLPAPPVPPAAENPAAQKKKPATKVNKAPGGQRSDSATAARNDAQVDSATGAADAVEPLAPDEQALVAELARATAQTGDAARGATLFATATSACLSCHRVGRHGGGVGPELTKIATQQSLEQLIESVLWPQRQVKAEYVAHTLLTDAGQVVRGYRVREDARAIVLRDPATGAEQEFLREELESFQESGSLMPTGVVATWDTAARADLFCFLSDLGKHERLSLERCEQLLEMAHPHAPAEFVYDRAPLEPEHSPNWQHHVNRERIYDFYRKQAQHFRSICPTPLLLSEFPGLDGGVAGHWGNQNESTWVDDRWNQTVLSSLQSGVFHGDKLTVPRAVCVQLGDKAELFACFDPDTLRYRALWSGEFLRFSEVRHGFMHGVTAAGPRLPLPAAAEVAHSGEYRGFYRHGQRVIFSYRVADQEYLDAAWVRDGQFERIVAPAAEHPLRNLTRGGPPQWPQVFEVRGVLGQARPYTVDTIPLPGNNPWKSLMFLGDHDFLPDGSVVVCTMQGDVWKATGLDDSLQQVRWRRIANGLHDALGLVCVGEEIYVRGRDQITRLHDLNGDGEIDFYECFSRASETSPAGHDYTCGLQRDADGNFYTATGKQGLLKISADGRDLSVLATGLRNPDGLGLYPDGTVTVPQSEGEWVSASMICAVRPDTHDQPPHFGHGGPRGGQMPDVPLVYLPRGVDNSSGGQVYVDSDRWGPLSGQMVHLSFGTASHFLLLRDEVDGQLQGAVVPLRGEFHSGTHRGRFHPVDGQLYVSGMNGWGNYAIADGCLHRVRYTRDRVQLPVAFHIHENGVWLRFTEPVDAEVAAAAEHHFAQCWNYRYSSGYGSPEFSSRHLDLRGHDVLPITAAHCLGDGRELFLEIPDLQPVNQLHLTVATSAADAHEMFLTVHRLDAPRTDLPGYQPREKTLRPHPLAVDMARATRTKPNPFVQPIDGARPIVLETATNLSFKTRQLRVRAGEAIQLTLDNPDVVPHNWALLAPGALERVGDLANKLITDPDAAANHYIPDSPDVLAYTSVVGPLEKFTIHFHAPPQPGRYPYLCTFPGHWMVMNGELIVE